MAETLSKAEYDREVFWGRIAWVIYMAIPTFLPFGWFLWLLPSAGWYAYDEGYDAYVWRCSATLNANLDTKP